MIDRDKLFGKPSNQNKILRTLARSGVPEILQSLKNGPKKFSQLMFEAKLNPGVLDRNLKALIELEIITKNNNLYELTDKGREVSEFIKKLYETVSNK